jgi:hypothetical protein
MGIANTNRRPCDEKYFNMFKSDFKPSFHGGQHGPGSAGMGQFDEWLAFVQE